MPETTTLRKMYKQLFLICCLLCLLGCAQQYQDMSYLGQKSPGTTPQTFAPNIISLKDRYEFGSVFSEAADEFYYGVDTGGKAHIEVMYLSDGVWSQPQILVQDDKFSFNDPFLSNDETKLYFISDHPTGDGSESQDYDIWYITRESGTWSEPINVGPPINTDAHEYYISFNKAGSMFFASNVEADSESTHNFDMYVSAFDGTTFQSPVNLGPQVNTPSYEADVFVAPDESYLIFSASRDEGLGRGDLYISFNNNGTWTTARNMGNLINSEGHELCPFVSKDGRYFFYTSNQEIMWVEASVIEQFRG